MITYKNRFVNNYNENITGIPTFKLIQNSYVMWKF